MAARDIGPLAELNRRFTQKFVDAYDCLAQDSLEALPREWHRALKRYLAQPEDYLVVLSRMAIAHIWRDLYDVLLALYEEVPEAHYNSVYDDILHCLEQIGDPYTNAGITKRILSLMYDSSRPARNATIWTMRTLVYKRAQKRSRTGYIALGEDACGIASRLPADRAADGARSPR